jgi:hypothetical protein
MSMDGLYAARGRTPERRCARSRRRAGPHASGMRSFPNVLVLHDTSASCASTAGGRAVLGLLIHMEAALCPFGAPC